MPPSDVLSQDEVRRLPPMLFGRIRWPKGFGAPAGAPCTGFRILVEEHTASQFRAGPGGQPEVIPGTGIWRTVTESAPCRSLPDEGDWNVLGFDVPDVHLNKFPDGGYRIKPTLTGNWSEPSIQIVLGFRRIEPLSHQLSLTEGNQVRSVDFEVVHEPLLYRTFG